MLNDELLRPYRERYERNISILDNLKKEQKKIVRDVALALGILAATFGVYQLVLHGKAGGDVVRHVRNAAIAVNGANIALFFRNLKHRVFNLAHYDMQLNRNRLNWILQKEFVEEGKDPETVVTLPVVFDTLEELYKAGKL